MFCVSARISLRLADAGAEPTPCSTGASKSRCDRERRRRLSGPGSPEARLAIVSGGWRMSRTAHEQNGNWLTSSRQPAWILRPSPRGRVPATGRRPIRETRETDPAERRTIFRLRRLGPVARGKQASTASRPLGRDPSSDVWSRGVTGNPPPSRTLRPAYRLPQELAQGSVGSHSDGALTSAPGRQPLRAWSSTPMHAASRLRVAQELGPGLGRMG